MTSMTYQETTKNTYNLRNRGGDLGPSPMIDDAREVMESYYNILKKHVVYEEQYEFDQLFFKVFGNPETIDAEQIFPANIILGYLLQYSEELYDAESQVRLLEENPVTLRNPKGLSTLLAIAVRMEAKVWEHYHSKWQVPANVLQYAESSSHIINFLISCLRSASQHFPWVSKY